MSVKSAIKIFVVLILIGNLAYYATFLFYPPAGAVVLLALGRGPDTEFGAALQSYLRYYKHFQYQEQIRKDFRILKQEPDGLQLVETPDGNFWESGPGGSIVPSQLAELRSKYDGFAKLPIRPNDIVLDCGANVGVFTRAALDAGARLVVAIEPAPKNVACLRRNFPDEIASGRVIVYEKGVWDMDDFLTLYEDEVTTAEDGFVRHKGAQPGPVIPLTTIDKLVEELKLEKVDFIKMDIEGAEQRALAGAQKTLAKHRPRLEISVNHLPDDPVKVPLLVRKAWPEYRMDYLRCSGFQGSWRIEPEILYFY